MTAVATFYRWTGDGRVLNPKIAVEWLYEMVGRVAGSNFACPRKRPADPPRNRSYGGSSGQSKRLLVPGIREVDPNRTKRDRGGWTREPARANGEIHF